jgi:hypothetical protein
VKYSLAIALLALGFLSSTRAKGQGVPAASNVPGAQTPSIHSDRRIGRSSAMPRHRASLRPSLRMAARKF